MCDKVLGEKKSLHVDPWPLRKGEKLRVEIVLINSQRPRRVVEVVY